MVFYVNLCYVMLCYITLRYVTLRYVTLRYVLAFNTCIPANCPVFGGTVQFFEVSDSKKLDCPVFLKF